jgi:phage terminase small subunit
MTLTPKQEAFCLAYIETGNASEAYRRSYNAKNMKPETINKRASELLADGEVKGRVEEHQTEHQKRHEVTVDSLTNEYEASRILAMDLHMPAAATAAVTGKSRIHGLDKGSDTTVNNTQINMSFSDLELARRIAHLLERGINDPSLG